MPRAKVRADVSQRNPEAPPTRSVRGRPRDRQGDTQGSTIDFLAQHAGSTTGDLAKSLNLDPGNVSTRLAQLAKTGEIKRASHGYRAM